MKRTRKYLLAVWICVLLVSAFVLIVFECNVGPIGMLVGKSNSEFVLMSVMELLTVVAIPLALRLFKFRHVHEELVRRKEVALLKWGMVRLAILAIPFISNMLLYYLFMQVAFGYMAIIVMICMVFVYPGKERCAFEVHNTTDCE